MYWSDSTIFECFNEYGVFGCFKKGFMLIDIMVGNILLWFDVINNSVFIMSGL